MIDLRSDTVTKPTAAMREAIATADVGDDVYGDDPTVNELEAFTAELLGKEAAVFVPTGSMSNQIALRAHTEPGDLVLIERRAHIVTSEGGGGAAISGVTMRTIDGVHGVFGPGDVAGLMSTPHPFNPSTLASPPRLL
jgi:threonine aldolase